MVGEFAIAARVTAPAAIRATPRVIGHFPEYIELGERLGSRLFSVPTHVWDAMSPAEQWAANQRFLDRGIRAGAEFIMATKREAIRLGSALEKEVSYLLQNGYQWAHDGSRLIPR